LDPEATDSPFYAVHSALRGSNDNRTTQFAVLAEDDRRASSVRATHTAALSELLADWGTTNATDLLDSLVATNMAVDTVRQLLAKLNATIATDLLARSELDTDDAITKLLLAITPPNAVDTVKNTVETITWDTCIAALEQTTLTDIFTLIQNTLNKKTSMSRQTQPRLTAVLGTLCPPANMTPDVVAYCACNGTNLFQLYMDLMDLARSPKDPIHSSDDDGPAKTNEQDALHERRQITIYKGKRCDSEGGVSKVINVTLNETFSYNEDVYMRLVEFQQNSSRVFAYLKDNSNTNQTMDVDTYGGPKDCFKDLDNQSFRVDVLGG